MTTHLHPEHLKRFPHLGDQTQRPYMFYLKSGKIVKEHRLVANLPHLFRKKWGKKTWELGWTCFMSGANLYGYDPRLETIRNAIPWGISLDHLIPDRHKQFLEPEYHSAIDDAAVIVGKHINHKLGHIPLAPRAILRQSMKKIDFNRETPSHEEYMLCRKHIFDVMENMKNATGKHYIWQHALDNPPTIEKQTAEVFAEMLDIEREFLRMSSDERQDWLDSFRWKW